MTYKIKFLEMALLELDDAKEYYEYQQKDLGLRFLLNVKKSVKLIEDHPKAWHPVTLRARRCLVKDFPYGIVYQIRENEIFIIAVANLHRKPNYWTDRVK